VSGCGRTARGHLGIANATGLAERMKAMVDTCMAEYDLHGWNAPDLINPDDVSRLARR